MGSKINITRNNTHFLVITLILTYKDYMDNNKDDAAVMKLSPYLQSNEMHVGNGKTGSGMLTMLLIEAIRHHQYRSPSQKDWDRMRIMLTF
jgi:hypothetical protein